VNLTTVLLETVAVVAAEQEIGIGVRHRVKRRSGGSGSNRRPNSIPESVRTGKERDASHQCCGICHAAAVM